MIILVMLVLHTFIDDHKYLVHNAFKSLRQLVPGIIRSYIHHKNTASSMHEVALVELKELVALRAP